METNNKKKWYLAGEETEGGSYIVTVHDSETHKYVATLYLIDSNTGEIIRKNNIKGIMLKLGYNISTMEFNSIGQIKFSC